MTAAPPDLGVALALAYGAFVDELRADLARHGFEDLNRSFGYVARSLAEGPMTLRDLARHLAITSQGAIKIVDDLERSGYVERVDDPNDGRAKQLKLTRRGKAALAAARKFHRLFEERLAAHVGPRAVAGLRQVLQAIVEERTRHGVPPVLRPV